ncbi:MAG: exo-beta-N-acetylmuramidase NamZ domain-containing protein [bacterium]
MKKLVLFVLCSVVVTACYFVGLKKPLRFGIDVLQENKFKDLKDAGRIGVLTHKASTNSDNIPTCDVFIEAAQKKGILEGRLVCFFAPEHGFGGTKEAGEGIKREFYKGFEVRKFYGASKSEILEAVQADCFKDIDTLVIDLRDIGVRYYCYNTCMRFALQKAIKENKKVYILDRPNPLGRKVAGLRLEEDLQAYVGGFCVPHVYGMTMGELANMVIQNYIPHPWFLEAGLNLEPADLEKAKTLVKIIRVENWDSQKTWPEQEFKKGYCWHAPSPNIPCFKSAQAYAGSIAVMPYGNFTTRFHDEKSDAHIDNVWIQPFVLLQLPKSRFPGIGALDPISAQLNALKLPGVSFFVNPEELGINLDIKDWAVFNPWSFVMNALFLDRQIDKAQGKYNKFRALSEEGLEYAGYDPDIPFSKYWDNPNRKDYWDVIRSILGNKKLIECMSHDNLTKEEVENFVIESQKQCKEFEAKRKAWLLY